MKHIDTTWQQWHQRHPLFPGVDYCVDLLKRRNTQGERIDTICAVLEANAAEHSAELLAAANDPSNSGVRLILLGPIENAALESAIPFWSRLLLGADATERVYAVRALRLINTKESRRLLWESAETSR